MKNININKELERIDLEITKVNENIKDLSKVKKLIQFISTTTFIAGSIPIFVSMLNVLFNKDTKVGIIISFIIFIILTLISIKGFSTTEQIDSNLNKYNTILVDKKKEKDIVIFKHNQILKDIENKNKEDYINRCTVFHNSIK